MSVYKDAAMTSLIAKTYQDYYLSAADFEPGKIDVISVLPAKLDVQAFTNVIVTFKTQNVLNNGTTSIKIECPASIGLPSVGSQIEVYGTYTLQTK